MVGFYHHIENPPLEDAPELNPVEMIWKRIRANYFNNKTFETIDDVEETLNTALVETYQSKDEIKQLTNYKWLQ